MKKTVRKPVRQIKSKKTQKRNLIFFFVMFPILALTLYAMLQPQVLRQFAQSANAPALFGCLHTGEADPTLCGTKLGQEGKIALKVNGKPFNGQLVYYNDTVSGSFTYKSVGDQPINIKNYGIAAGSLKQYYIATFEPVENAKTLKPNETLSAGEFSYTFKTPDPNQGYVVGPGITDTNGQPLPIKDSAVNLRVSSACTALRVKPLTAKDKTNIQSLCSKDPKNILCTSREYCELFKGGQCTGPVLATERDAQQCDQYVVLDKKEQDILEQLCKTYPDSDACVDFCKRAIDSKICPPITMWFDKNGKQVFPQPAKYMASVAQPAVAGTKTGPGGTTSGLATYCDMAGNNQCVGQGVCQPTGTGRSGVCSGGTIQPPKPPVKVINPFPPKPPGPGVDQRSSQGYKPSCPSHRANLIGQCCASDFPLINGCCQPGCFVWHSETLNRNNCPYKSKSGVCCSQAAVEQYGYCMPTQIPKNGQKLPGNDQIPRDTNKIFPPTYNPGGGSSGGGNPGSGGGGNPGTGSGGGSGQGTTYDPKCAGGDKYSYNAQLNVCERLYPSGKNVRCTPAGDLYDVSKPVCCSGRIVSGPNFAQICGAGTPGSINTKLPDGSKCGTGGYYKTLEDANACCPNGGRQNGSSLDNVYPDYRYVCNP